MYDTTLVVDQNGTDCLLASREEVRQDWHLSVFPNPAVDQLWVGGLDLSNDRYEVSLVNLLGQSFPLPYPSQIRSDHFVFQLEGLNTGIYLLSVEDRRTGAREARRITLVH